MGRHRVSGPPRTLKMRSLGTELLIDVIDLATDLG
jgi:hypothetical protein